MTGVKVARGALAWEGSTAETAVGEVMEGAKAPLPPPLPPPPPKPPGEVKDREGGG